MPRTAFVSMPFGRKPKSAENEWTKLFDHGIKPLQAGLREVKGYRRITIWRADTTLKSLALKTNVMRQIEQATFVLAILTTSVVEKEGGERRISNPNVLWELGYAEAIGKPIVVLADNEDARSLPLLAGLPNVCTYEHRAVQGIGSSNAAAALRHIAVNLAPYVMEACEDAKRGRPMSPVSHAVTYPNRDDINLAGLVSSAEQHVDILTTNMHYFVTGSFGARKGARHPFARALNKGATVRIVTMDPESVIAEYRAKQLGRGDDVPGYRKELRDGIVQLYELLGRESQFYLHIYNDLPLQITSRVDETIVTSVVTRGERARKRIQIQFNLHDEGVTESFVSHFQSMFEDSKDVHGVAWVLRHGLSEEAEEDAGAAS